MTGFCSAHWFDVHQDGFVALGHYGAGLRIIDVRDPREIAQYGYATGVATQVWDAYWVPERDAAGVAIPGQKTNIVYTADAVRGIEVFEVTLPPPAPRRPPSRPRRRSSRPAEATARRAAPRGPAPDRLPRRDRPRPAAAARRDRPARHGVARRRRRARRVAAGPPP